MFRVVYEVEGQELVLGGFWTLKAAAAEAWHLRHLGFTAWAESVA